MWITKLRKKNINNAGKPSPSMYSIHWMYNMRIINNISLEMVCFSHFQIQINVRLRHKSLDLRKFVWMVIEFCGYNERSELTNRQHSVFNLWSKVLPRIGSVCLEEVSGNMISDSPCESWTAQLWCMLFLRMNCGLCEWFYAVSTGWIQFLYPCTKLKIFQIWGLIRKKIRILGPNFHFKQLC